MCRTTPNQSQATDSSHQARAKRAIVGGYLVGSIPFGFLLARLVGISDIRRHGSGNIGATNVLRTMGWPLALTVLVLDAAKGASAVLLMHLAGASPEWLVLGGLAAIAGHMWPFTLRFRGGRGAATGLGALCALSPIGALVAAGSFVVVVAATRYVSAGSISAAVIAAVAVPLAGGTWGQSALIGLCCAAIIWAHRPNIRRLLSGTESKLALRRPAANQVAPGAGATAETGSHPRS